MSDSSPLPLQDGPEVPDAFIGKWRARWPEWSVAEVFVAPPDRSVALAWASLQQELTDAAWGGNDARPGEAKLLWWQEELIGWSLGRRRHPLGTTLQRLRAPWGDFAAALPTLRASRERPRDGAEAFSLLLPLATAAATVERALFAGMHEDDAGTARLIAATWLQARLVGEDAAAVPLSAMAHGGAGSDGHGAEGWWRAELLREWPAVGRATRPRQLWAALARARLMHGSAAQPLGAWQALWTAWRAARN